MVHSPQRRLKAFSLHVRSTVLPDNIEVILTEILRTLLNLRYLVPYLIEERYKCSLRDELDRLDTQQYS